MSLVIVIHFLSGHNTTWLLNKHVYSGIARCFLWHYISGCFQEHVIKICMRKPIKIITLKVSMFKCPALKETYKMFFVLFNIKKFQRVNSQLFLNCYLQKWLFLCLWYYWDICPFQRCFFFDKWSFVVVLRDTDKWYCVGFAIGPDEIWGRRRLGEGENTRIISRENMRFCWLLFT